MDYKGGKKKGLWIFILFNFIFFKFTFKNFIFLKILSDISHIMILLNILLKKKKIRLLFFYVDFHFWRLHQLGRESYGDNTWT